MGYGNDNVSITGTEMKFALSLELPGGLTMDEVGFEARFYVYSNRTVTIPKSGMTRIDGDTYVVTLDTSLIGEGRIKCQVRVEIPDANTANSVQTANGEAITGDPGGLAVYNFSIAVTVPANTEIDPKTRQVIVTDEGGHQDVCLLTLAAGDAYLRVTEGDIQLDYHGNPVTVNVESNTDWTVE